MTTPNAMTTQELLESAALDAFGLLDEYESALFTRSFHHAPASVQGQVLELQAEMITDESLLPDAVAPDELRQRVLNAVAAAIDRESVRLEPLATIGRGHQAASEYQPSQRLSLAGQFWRAAVFVLAGAVIVMAYFWSDAQRHGNRIAELALEFRTDTQLKEYIGSDFGDFINNPNCIARAFQPATDDYPGAAMVYINVSTNQAFVLGLAIPSSEEPYTLEMKREDGTFQKLATFFSDGWITSLRLDNVPAQLASQATWQITTATGATVLRSA